MNPLPPLTGDDKLTFGKWENTPLKNVPSHYLDWLLGKAFIAERFPRLHAYCKTRRQAEQAPTSVQAVRSAPKAPTERPIPAQGNALGTVPPPVKSPEGAKQTPYQAKIQDLIAQMRKEAK